jgi:hypothetical protein
MNLTNFKEQIKEDILHIQEEWGNSNSLLNKEEYAFNYWILGRIYDMEESIMPDIITEYNDKGIDCYVHYEDSKELFIIQNKYYDDNTALNRKDVSDFLKTPLDQLKAGIYKRNKELQSIFKDAYKDPEYKINFHFYVTNMKKNADIELAFKGFNQEVQQSNKVAILRANIYYLEDIYKLYFGQSFKESQLFSFSLKTKNKGTVLQILPEQYKLENMSEAYYIMTPVSQLHDMYQAAKDKDYPIFEENIREYLGKNNVNNGIINTLKNANDRHNFFYYNNGITVICDKVEKKNAGEFSLIRPQIVNGCQTVNTIYEVLSDYKPHEIQDEFSTVFVMVKVLVFNKEVKERKPNFYKDIVKFTNKQNAINEEAFAVQADVFASLQSGFLNRGFLLQVKTSDKYKFRQDYIDRSKQQAQLFVKATTEAEKIGVIIAKLSDIEIPLVKLLQVFVALDKDVSHAYKKSLLLKPTSDIYKNYSTKIQNKLTIDNMIRLYLIYKKAELERIRSDDKKKPIPYYLVGIFGYFIKDKSRSNEVIEKLFNDKELLKEWYQYLVKLVGLYRKKHPEEHNVMIKQPLNIALLEEQIETLGEVWDSPELEKFIKFMAKKEVI